MRTVLFTALVLCGCGERGEEPPAADEQAIQGGAVDGRDPAIGLVWLRGGGFCSGTLVGPSAVLTAGHCVESPVAGFYTGTGSGAATVDRLPASGLVAHRVVAQLAHPAYHSSAQCPNRTPDVALLRLDKAVEGVVPVPLAKLPPAEHASCRAVGYGVHDDGAQVTVEQRRSATEIVEAVSRGAIQVTRSSGIVDHGDSGGPLLCKRRIAGTVSCGSSVDELAWYARVDSVADWVTATIAEWQ